MRPTRSSSAPKSLPKPERGGSITQIQIQIRECGNMATTHTDLYNHFLVKLTHLILSSRVPNSQPQEGRDLWFALSTSIPTYTLSHNTPQTHEGTGKTEHTINIYLDTTHLEAGKIVTQKGKRIEQTRIGIEEWKVCMK